ncbi:MAG TPA: ferritin [Longimicrobiales bacterium]|nr:ferritin [Longimicrobiales bacterium]
MDPKIQEALDEQIRAELHSAYIYLAMSAHFAEQNLDGFAHWMRLQAGEELGHAMRLYDYVLERGGHLQLLAVDAPPSTFGSPLEIFEAALAHEKKITAMIHALYDLARKKSDYATELQLQWFVTEQVEEEDSAGRAVEQLRLAGSNTSALLMLDRQMGQRTGAA